MVFRSALASFFAHCASAAAALAHSFVYISMTWCCSWKCGFASAKTHFMRETHSSLVSCSSWGIQSQKLCVSPYLAQFPVLLLCIELALEPSIRLVSENGEGTEMLHLPQARLHGCSKLTVAACKSIMRSHCRNNGGHANNLDRGQLWHIISRGRKQRGERSM